MAATGSKVFAAAFAFWMLTMSGCERSASVTPDDFKALKAQVQQVQSDLDALKVRLNAPAVAPTGAIEPSATAEMQVTDGTQHYARPYATVPKCESALSSVLAENGRRRTQMEADNTRATEAAQRSGAGFFQQGDFVHVEAYCVPLR
jgi:hypothetical protein